MEYSLLIAFIFVIFADFAVSSNYLKNVDSISAHLLTDGCNHVDIRYEKINFDQLKNCRVVLNGLKISDISDDLSDLQFPKLTEITGYLMINNVRKLKTLKNLFPNLAVIRGNILIDDSAMLLTNNANLENVCLESLSYVGRGHLTFENNPKLCYINTVAWKDFFTTDSQAMHSRNNKNISECGTCSVNVTNCWDSETVQANKSRNTCKDSEGKELFAGSKECLGEKCLNGTECYACKEYSETICEDGKDCNVHCISNTEKSTNVTFNNFYVITEDLCRQMKKHPLENVCLERCPVQIYHFYNETSKSCIYDESPERKMYYKYCPESIEIDGLDGLLSSQSMNCTMVSNVIIRNISESSTVDIEARLFDIFKKLGDIRHCLLIENSPGISSLHFMPYLGEIRGNCKSFNYSDYSTVILGNENLHHFFMQGFKSKRGAVLVQNNSALCQDQIDMFMKQSDIKKGSSLQTSACDISVIKFNVLPSYETALFHMDKLEDGVDYNLVNVEAYNESSKIEVKLLNDSLELALNANTSYNAVITYKAKGDVNFKFNSSLKSFRTRAFEGFLNITNIRVTSDSSNIQWANLNNLENAFYLVVIKRAQPATQIKNGWDHTNKCLMKTEQQPKLTGYEKYYFRQLVFPDDFPEKNISKTFDTNITLTNLSQATCYDIDIYLCQAGNIRRCTQPTSKIILTNEIIIPYVMTPVQRTMIYVVPVAVIAIYLGYRIFYKYRKIKKQVAIPLDPDTPLTEVLEGMNYNFENSSLTELIEGNYEIKKEDIVTGEYIGAGFFGEVFVATYNDRDNKTETIVAIKTVRNADKNYDKFFDEAKKIKSLQTHHIVKLIGFVLKREPWIVMEYMENKDLGRYLKENKPSENSPRDPIPGYSLLIPEVEVSKPPIRSFHDMAIEIADGMAYLAANNCVHRDLAARNCMVAGDLTVKIGDFGLTRDVTPCGLYQQTHIEAMPIRWMAPESVIDQTFSEDTDVWSFGIVCWEIVTYGETPFPNYKDDTVSMLIRDGYTPHLPENCDDDFKSIMNLCWRKDPKKKKLTFMEIVRILLPLITHLPKFEKVSYYHNL